MNPAPPVSDGHAGPEHDIIVLGPVSLRSGQSTTVVRGQQGKVLALLVAEYPRVVSVDKLVRSLWSDSPPSSARTGLGVVLHRVRERLGGTDVIVNEHDGYRLQVVAERIDRVHFQTGFDSARAAFEASDFERARDLVADALELWHGDAYQPFDDDEAIRASASELHEQRCGAEDLMFESLLATGRTDEAANWAQRLVSATPYREARWYALALSLYHCQRQAEALRSITEASRVLRTDIGVELGPELRQLERDILQHAVPELTVDSQTESDPDFETSEIVDVHASTSRIGDPETSYIDRDREIEAVVSRLESSRFVTVLGAAGAGKTRLVARLVRSLQRRVVWVDLAPLDAVDVLPALANELGISANADDRPARIAKALASEPTVVVLDNCEHVVATASEAARVITASAPTSQVLATSRIALGDATENCFVLPNLSVEDGARLLLDRAFGDTTAHVDGEQLGLLVKRLEANPLLLELVAEPVRTLSVEAVNDQLARVLGQSGLTRDDHRHTSLTAAIEWSVTLLDPEEQELYAALGVMRGSFRTSDVSEVVGRQAARVESQLETLCRHGLLAADARSGDVLYRQPEAAAIDARRRLDLGGSGMSIVERHTATFTRLVDELCPQLWTADEPHAVEKLGHARGQLAATQERLIERGDVERAASFAIAMWDYSFLRLDVAQFDWTAEVLKLQGVQEISAYPDLLGTAAMAAWAQNDFYRSLRFADEAIAATGSDEAPLQALRARFNVASFREPGLGAMEPFGELISATIGRGAPHLRCDLEVLLALGMLHIDDAAGASESARRAMATAEQIMSPSCLAWASYGLGSTLLDTDPSAAARYFLAAARQARTVGNRFVESMARGGLATSARRRGRSEQARVLLIEAIENWDRLESTPQLIRSCREAVLLLADIGETVRAQKGLTLLELVDLGHPLPPLDQARFDSLVSEIGYLDEPDLIGGDRSVVGEILMLLT